MEKSKLNSFLQRLIVTIILVPLVIFCIMKGYTTVYLLALLGSALHNIFFRGSNSCRPRLSGGIYF